MTFSYLTGVCKAAIEGLNETRERVGYEKERLKFFKKEKSQKMFFIFFKQ